MPDDPAAPEEHGAEPSRTQADVARAISAAEEAGLSNYRVEIGPDGMVTIVVGAAPAAREDPRSGQ